MENNNEIPVYYINGVNIRVSMFDILFEFGKNFPIINEETKEVKPEFIPEFKVFMSPHHLKSFVEIINKQLDIYEKNFGTINIEPQVKKEKDNE